MTAYIILGVVLFVLLIGVGGVTLLRPRGMHGVRRSRARELDLTGEMPKVSDDTSAGSLQARILGSPVGDGVWLAPPCWQEGLCAPTRALRTALVDKMVL